MHINTFYFQISSVFEKKKQLIYFPVELQAEEDCMTFQGKLKSFYRILKAMQAMLCKAELLRFVLQYKHVLIVSVSSISLLLSPMTALHYS